MEYNNIENNEIEPEAEKQELANPLVSIIVITYNSSKYVLETLESAKAQTYQNIELIVSDDCSTDNTVEICREWIEEHKERFVRTELLTIDRNTGIPANCNRGLFEAQGEWVKFIAGDDALIENCILDNINRINEIPENVYALHSEVKYYSSLLDENFLLYKTDKKLDVFCNNLIRAGDQLKLLVRGYGPHATTAFFNRNVLLELEGFNEELPYEDGPIWVKLTLKNFKIYYLNKITIKYRLHDSISNSVKGKLLFGKIYELDKVVFDKIYKPHLMLYEIISQKAIFLIKDLFCYFRLNKRNLINLFIFRLLSFPFSLLLRITFIGIDNVIKKNIKYGEQF